MNTNVNPNSKDGSCLTMINNLRKQVAETLNNSLNKAVALEGGNQQLARKIFESMLNCVDVSTMLDVLTDLEREESYEKIHMFFSGMEISIFNFEPVETHHFEKLNYTVLDLVFVYKVNIQERINENLKCYREYNRNADNMFNRDQYLNACYNILSYCEKFKVLTDKEIRDAESILNAHKKKNFKKTEIIYIPKNLYSKID